MKVVLIRPPKIQGALERSMVQHPINLLYLAAVLREYGQGFETEIWDFEVENFSEKILRERMRKSSPKVVGFTSMTCNIKECDRIADWLKEEDRTVTIVVGGPHSSAIPERTLKEFNNFDAIVVGEGEQTFVEFREAGQAREKCGRRGLDGLAQRERNKNGAGPPLIPGPGLAAQPRARPD